MALGGVVLAATSVAARRGVSRGELDCFEAVYRWPGALEPALWLPMQLGTALAPVVVAPVIAVVTRDWRPAVGAATAGLAGWWAAKGVKEVVGRGRPGAHVDGFVARWGTPRDGTGFPSGHVTVAVALAASVSPDLAPVGRAVVWGVAATVGLARVQVGAHLPLDVVGGAALGLGLAGLGRLIIDEVVHGVVAAAAGCSR